MLIATVALLVALLAAGALGCLAGYEFGWRACTLRRIDAVIGFAEHLERERPDERAAERPDES